MGGAWRILLVLAAVGCLWGASIRADDEVGRLESGIRVRTVERAHKRSDTLLRDPALQAIARAHSKSMYQLGTLGHVLKDGMGPEQRVARHHRRLFALVAENVGYVAHWPPRTDLARRFVEAWMKSPGHRRNILAPYRVIEVGCHGDAGVMYCTQLFARDVHYLQQPVSYEVSPGGSLQLRLQRGEDTSGWRVSLEGPREDAAVQGVPLEHGAARLTVPARAGPRRLKLWILEPGKGDRFRVIGGPDVSVGPSG